MNKLHIAEDNASTLIMHPGGLSGYIIFDRAGDGRALLQMRESIRQHWLLPSK